MIYVKRDPSLIPEKLLAMAEKAQADLETIPAADRVAFIKKRSRIWRAFKTYLAKMSYGKCWYSESKGPQSPYDVDHFRPKSEARRSEIDADEGYPWLAFDWDNFRYSAELSNRPNTDEESGEVVGKSSWFPLVNGSPVACWGNRCVRDERPLLLDPTVKADVELIDVNSEGLMVPTELCTPAGKDRVAASIKIYGLHRPELVTERRQAMVAVGDEVEKLMLAVQGANEAERGTDAELIEKVRSAIMALTLPDQPFALAARRKVIDLGLARFLAGPEDYPAIAA